MARIFVAAVLLAAVLASANAQCEYNARSAKSASLSDGVCVASQAYQASLTGSSNAIDQFISGSAQKGINCVMHITKTDCAADTANVCAWQGDDSKGTCSSNASGEELAKCAKDPKTPVCELFAAVMKYCPSDADKATCEAKTGCAYSTTCGLDQQQTTVVAATLAKDMGSSYAPRILAVSTECAKFNTSATCTAAKVNGAAGVMRQGSMLMALAAAVLLALALVE